MNKFLYVITGLVIGMFTIGQVFAATPPISTYQGGTGLRGMSTGSIPFGSVANLRMATSSSLFWNNTNAQLGIGTSSPKANVHIATSLQLGTGTISDDGNGNITGVGTVFTTELRVGDSITNGAGSYSTVITITNDTSMYVQDSNSYTNTTWYYIKPGLEIDNYNGGRNASFDGYGGVILGAQNPTGTQGFLQINNGVAFNGILFSQSGGNYIFTQISNGASNQKNWLTQTTGTQFKMSTADDSYAPSDTYLQATRSGTTISNVSFPSGNVGVGSTTPGTKLSIGDTGANTINISETATSTFGSGINLRTGCFAVNNVCAGTGSGTVNSGVFGQMAFYGANGTILSGTSTIVVGTTTADANNVGIGTTTPNWNLDVASTLPNIALTDTDAGANLKHWVLQNNGGTFTLGTTSDSFVSNATPWMSVTGAGAATFKGKSFTYTIEAGSKFAVQIPSISNNISMIRFGETAPVSGTPQRIFQFSDFGDGTEYFSQDIAVGGHPVFNLHGKDFIWGISPSGAYSEIARLTNTGLFGLATTTPWARMSVGNYLGGSSPMFVIASSSGALATSTYMVVDAFGKTGIGSSTPYATLSVQSNNSVTDIYSFGTTSSQRLSWSDPKGNQYTGGDIPVLSSCGTGAVIFAGSNNNAGRLQVGSTALQTSCTVTFADGGWLSTANAPSCDANIEGGLTIFTAASTTQTTLLITSAATFTSDFVTYQCRGF